MREKNRKPIEKVQRLPQFTIMNAIGGQAGIFINSSLIFSSLTTDNILNIIVLLILAGVTLTLALSNNGVIGRAQQASNTWANATRDEETAMGQFASDVDTLTEGFINREGDSGGGSGGGSTGTTIKINGTDISTVGNLSTLYGQRTDFTSVEGVTWDLFYDDADNYYLIASDYVPGNTLPSELITTNQHSTFCEYFGIWDFDSSSRYKGTIIDNEPWSKGTESSTIKGNSLANKYLKWINSSLVTTNNNANMRAVAYMMDTSKWSEFAGDINGAYAIGGPTLEIFVNSYNAKHETKLGTYGTSASDITTENASEYGYKVKIGNESWNYYCEGLDTSNSAGNIWVLTSNTKASAYWLASPNSDGSTQVMSVYNDGSLWGAECDGTDDHDNGFRPMVVIHK